MTSFHPGRDTPQRTATSLAAVAFRFLPVDINSHTRNIKTRQAWAVIRKAFGTSSVLRLDVDPHIVAAKMQTLKQDCQIDCYVERSAVDKQGRIATCRLSSVYPDLLASVDTKRAFFVS